MAAIEVRPRRQLILHFSYVAGDDDTVVHERLVFEGVEAFKCTYYYARDEEMLAAYDKLVDVGASAWRNEIATNLARHRESVDDLVHLMINVDDGPCVEAVCRGFRIEKDP